MACALLLIQIHMRLMCNCFFSADGHGTQLFRRGVVPGGFLMQGCLARRTCCFGQITLADFAIADVTDSMLDGIIDGFPNTYASKVGKTSDEMYRALLAQLFSQNM